EIVRALLRDSRVVILDESTSMLTPAGIEELGGLMRRLVDRGLAVIFITHKLKEAAHFGDRVSVLKLGRKVGEIAPDRFRRMDEDALVAEFVELMFGKRSGDPEDVAPEAHSEIEAGAPILSVRGLNLAATAVAPGLTDVDLEIRPGEVLGIAGIDGNGQKQLADALSGQIHADSGVIILDQREVQNWPVHARRDAGLRYLTDDRLGEGTVGSFPISINLLLKQIGDRPFWRNGVEQRSVIDARARQLISEFDIRTPGPATAVARLSGGNIQ
ncbi:MAG: ATP-binding cassette domain-containing protein, partial [bacterium]|nr:ATP-binding cassette domain-containing protein [bacterium]